MDCPKGKTSDDRSNCKTGHHWFCLLDNPYQGVRDIEDVAVCKALLLEELEPMVGNGIQSGTFKGNAVHAILPMPNALICRDPVTDDHDRQWRVWGHVIVLLLDESCTVFGGQPIHSSDLATVDGLLSADWQVIVDCEHFRHVECCLGRRGMR